MKNQVSSRATPRAFKKFVRPTKPLAVALLEALQEELDTAIELGDFDSGLATALPGHEMDYESWLKAYAPHAASSIISASRISSC